jgi:CheY-like chemotaxis protein
VELVEDALDLFSHSTKQKGMMLLHHIDPRVPARISIDPTRLRQILINLIGNAVKFSPDGYVIVRVWKLPNPMGKISLYFEVEDTGPGIHPEMRPHLFESFNQLNSSLARKFGGTGLGLSISRKLSQMMGGDLRLIKSDERGTTFRGFVQAESLSCAWPETARSEDRATTAARILLIDQHPFSRSFHEDRFRSLGAPITSCANFDQALSIHKDSGFDVVIVNDPLGFACNGALPRLTTWANQPRLGVILTNVGEQRDLVWHGPLQVEYRMKPFRSFSVLHCARPELASPAPRRIQTGRSLPPPDDIGKALSEQPIWVVDDNAVNLKVAGLMLKRLGLAATTFSSGEAAIEALADPTIPCPAIIFMDLQMPGLNGLETTTQILSMSAAQPPYVIAMTAAATVEDRENCHAAGMRDFVPKPVKEAELLRVFQTFIRQTPEQQSA